MNNLAGEMVDLTAEVRTLRYSPIAQARFREQNQKLYTVGQKAQFYSSLVNPSTRFINHIAYVAVGVASALLSIAGRLSIGMIGSFLAYATQFAKPINEITSVMTQLQSALASADRVFELIDGQPIAGMSRDSVRRSFAMVLQDTWLFSGSIRENIAYAHPETSLEEVVAAGPGRPCARIH